MLIDIIHTLVTAFTLHTSPVGACELNPLPEPVSTLWCCSPPTATASGSCSPAPTSGSCPSGTKLHICSDVQVCDGAGACWYDECKLADDSQS